MDFVHSSHFVAIILLIPLDSIRALGVVILDYQCYVDKMMSILGDTSKFLRLGPVDNFDHTTSIETKFQRVLVELVKRGLLSSAISDQIRPTGSIQHRLYGLPKSHKDWVPLRPILSMVSSSQQNVDKWLDRILQPVLIHYSTYCIKDSFEFAGFIQKCSPLKKFMCSFDICSLLICVPILETVDICADMLCRSYLSPPDIPEVLFVELMKFTTTSVEFSFDNIMYRKMNGISMGSILGPTIAGIFVGFHEVDLFPKYKAPEVYFRYFDDTFCAFGSEIEAGEFFSHLNNMHPSLRFILEKENNFILPFLDVLVSKETSAFLTTVYR